MKFKRGDLVATTGAFQDFGIVRAIDGPHTRVHFITDYGTAFFRSEEWVFSDTLILVRGSNPFREAETTPVLASDDSERPRTPITAPEPPAKREAL